MRALIGQKQIQQLGVAHSLLLQISNAPHGLARTLALMPAQDLAQRLQLGARILEQEHHAPILDRRIRRQDLCVPTQNGFD